MRTQAEKIIIKNTHTNFTLHVKKLKEALLNLQSINHPVRLEIIKLLNQKQQLPVTQIYKSLKAEQSIISQHLSVLKNAGIVKAERQGKFIYYSLEKDMLEKVNGLIQGLYSKE